MSKGTNTIGRAGADPTCIDMIAKDLYVPSQHPLTVLYGDGLEVSSPPKAGVTSSPVTVIRRSLAKAAHAPMAAPVHPLQLALVSSEGRLFQLERSIFHVYIVLLVVFQKCKRKQCSLLAQPVAALDTGSRGRASKRIKLPAMHQSLFASLRYTFWLIIKTGG